MTSATTSATRVRAAWFSGSTIQPYASIAATIAPLATAGPANQAATWRGVISTSWQTRQSPNTAVSPVLIDIALATPNSPIVIAPSGTVTAITTKVTACILISSRVRLIDLKTSLAIEMIVKATTIAHRATIAWPAGRQRPPRRITAIGTPSGIVAKLTGTATVSATQ